jgi:hypothetical protein
MDGQRVPSSPGLLRLLVRALMVPVLVLLAVTGYLVAGTALADGPSSRALGSVRSPVTSDWKDGYSRQFPGCVASVLWPERETPVAIVVRWRSGEVDRIVMRHASHRVFARVRAGDAELIGACYRS